MPMTERALEKTALQLIDDAASVRSRDEAGERVFATLQRTIGFDTGVIMALDRPEAISVGKSERQLAVWRAGADRFVRDLRRLQPVARDLGHVFLDTSAISARDRERMPLYADYLRPHAVRSSLGTFLGAGGRYTHFMTIGTVGPGRAMDQRDADVFRRLWASISLAVGGTWSMGAPEEASGEYGLSPRELTICRLVSRGLRNREIAEICGTSSNTVRNQLAVIFRKVEVTTRAELAAIRLGS